MEEKFNIWLVKAEGKIEATGRSYSKAIHRISEHYSSHTGIPTNVYKADITELRKIRSQYESDGKFSEFGHESHGLYRAAIKALFRYRHAHPINIKVKNPKSNTKYRSTTTNKIKRQTKNNEKSLLKKIYEFFRNLFKSNNQKKIINGKFVGTKEQIAKYLQPFSKRWRIEVHQKYLIDNPKCQRCRSSEFPTVIEKHTLSKKKILKSVLENLPNKGKQAISISELEGQYKDQVSKGDRLIVLCRTCRKKENKLKLERFPHEMPAIMRKGPSEFKY